MSNLNGEELDREFQRQVFLCSGLGAERLLEIVRLFAANPEDFKKHFREPRSFNFATPCPRTCTEGELLAAKALWETLEVCQSHIYDINFDVFRNRVMLSTFGNAVLKKLLHTRESD